MSPATPGNGPFHHPEDPLDENGHQRGGDCPLEHHRQIVDSKAHFTRKFSASDPVLDLIDSDLGLIIPDRAQPPLSREITPQHARRQAKR